MTGELVQIACFTAVFMIGFALGRFDSAELERENEELKALVTKLSLCGIERILKLEKVAKELWLLLMFTGNDDAYAEIGFGGKKAVIDAYKLRDRMVDLGIVLPQVPMSDDDIIDYLSEELGIEVQDE